MAKERVVRFSWSRLVVFSGVAALMYRIGGAGTNEGILLGSGMLLLAVFAGFHDPLSPTDEHYLPRSADEWLPLLAGAAGLILFVLGAFV